MRLHSISKWRPLTGRSAKGTPAMVTTPSTRAVSHIILGTISVMGVVNIKNMHIFVATGIETTTSQREYLALKPIERVIQEKIPKEIKVVKSTKKYNSYTDKE
jgi:hypothetical protein